MRWRGLVFFIFCFGFDLVGVLAAEFENLIETFAGLHGFDLDVRFIAGEEVRV